MVLNAKQAETREVPRIGGRLAKAIDCMSERIIRRELEDLNVVPFSVKSAMSAADGSFVAKSKRTIDPSLIDFYGSLRGLEALPIALELRNLHEFSDVLGQAYEEAVRGTMARLPSCVDPDRILKREGRRAALSLLSPELRMKDGFYSTGYNPSFWRLSDMIEYDEIFNAAVYGHLSHYARTFLAQVSHENNLGPDPALELSFASSPSNKMIGKPVTKVDVWVGEEERLVKGVLFMKTCSMEPDLFAARLLAGSGVFTPEARNVRYEMPDGEEGGYGLILDVSRGSGGDIAFPLSRLSMLKQPAIEYLKPRLPELSKALGHAFEVCRLRGIQDRHTDNTWIMISGEQMKIAMIDLDLVCCYPFDTLLYQREFAAHLKSIAGYLSFLHDRPSTDDVEIILRKMRSSFLEGAAEANASDRERELHMAEEFKSYEGKPVGIFLGEGHLDNHFDYSEGGHFTQNALNGPFRQQLIVGGPDSGRFRFDAEMAWEYGYSAQSAIEPKEFWEWVFSIAERYPVRSIVY